MITSDNAILNRQRDAVFEKPIPDDYKALYANVINSIGFYSYPLVMVMHGDYGSGKTRMLRGLQACATQDGMPTTFFTPSQYDSDKTNLVNALIVKMGAYYLEKFDTTELRAKVIGTIAGSIDIMFKFCGKNAGILSAENSILDAIGKQREELLGEWTKYGDPVEAMKNEFAKMVWQVSELTGEFKRKPWIVLIDDLDRVFPENALDLVLGLRSLFGIGMPLEMHTKEELPPPIVFLLSMNVDCLRTAIRARYSTLFNEVNDSALSEFVEQFIRKYFVFGPTVPVLESDSIKKNLERSLPVTIPFPESNELIDRIVCLLKGSTIPYRMILQAFDRTLLHYLTCENNRPSNSTSVSVILFLLELFRNCSEQIFQSVVTNSKRNSGKAIFEIMYESTEKTISIRHFLDKINTDPVFADIKDVREPWKAALDMVLSG